MIFYDELKWIMQKLPVPNGWGAGKPMVLQPWQDQLLKDCFSTAERPEIVYVEIPRKNGKTTFTGALLCGLFVGDKEPGAEFYCASGDKEQAGIIYTIAEYMINNTPALSKRVRTVPSTKKFVNRDDHTKFFRSLSADAHSKHGYNPYVTIFDELHIFKTRELWDVMDTGDIAREHPMKIIITTAGTDMATLCGEMHEHAESVIKGDVVDVNFKPYIHTVKDKSRWTEEEQWKIANPSMQTGMINIERMRTKFTRAFGKPVAESAFKRLHLNIWQESLYQWVSIEKLDECAVTLPDSAIRGGIGGLDLGFGLDPTSFSIYKDGKSRTWIWMTDDEAQRIEKAHDVPWTKWMREGYVNRYGKDMADYDILERDLWELTKKYNVKKIAFDRWKSHHLINKMSKRLDFIPVGQGFVTMTMPIKHTEALIAAKKFQWHSNPAVRHAFKVIYIKEDAAGNAKPDKQKKFHKIDPVVSLFDAIAVAESQAPKKSVYENRGLV
jgi:phage terminase large subunit-like protein